jgi:hypothetical protein
VASRGSNFSLPALRRLLAIPQNSDVQLFGRHADPHELHNLALDPKKHGATTLRRIRLLKPLIESTGKLGPGG